MRYVGATLLILLLLVGSGVAGTKVMAFYAASGHSVPLHAGESQATADTTNYSGNDGGGGVFPPSTSIDWPANAGYHTVHNGVGGTGTFDDPITVAINSKNGPSGDVPDNPAYQIGEKFYVPRLHLYFVAEDSCNVDSGNGDECTDGHDTTKLHLDFFNGNITDPANFSNEQNCENSYGGSTQVIANAGSGYPMPDHYPHGLQAAALFVAPNTCIGATLWNEYSDWTIGPDNGGTTHTVKHHQPPLLRANARTNDPNWNLVWHDDFSGSRLDTTKWTVRSYAAGAFNHEQECYKDDGTHVRIDGRGSKSHLVLQADQPQGDSACQYVSGRLDTQGKYAVQPPTSGKPVRIEASMQLPRGGNGIWPAFWLLGQNIDTAGWPNCGEIDVMEHIPQMGMSTIQSTVHGLNGASDFQKETLSSGTYSAGYHLISVDWYTDHMVFSVDGHATAPINTTQLGGNQVFNQPFYILLNLAVGGDWPGNADSSTPFPQQMNVAFVRVYQHS